MMGNVLTLKTGICTALGCFGGLIATLFGGWDTGLMILVVLMAVDYVTGLMVAGIFHKSRKTDGGTLDSSVGWKGLCKKGVTLLIVLVAQCVDTAAGTTIIRDAVVIGYSANEAISIIENAGLIGIPVPAQLVKAIEALKGKGDAE